MYLFYVDETGNRDPRLEISRADGTRIPGDPIYVLTAVCLFDQRWHGFEKTLNRHKSMLIDLVHRSTGQRLQLSDCEVKSNWVRMPRERAAHPLLGRITDPELLRLTELFYQQLHHHHMKVFSVVVDKAKLPAYMDQTKLHRKSWELLLELIETFMRCRHDKHQALMVTDDVGRQENHALAMKHAYIMDQGTRASVWLRHICEMPMFVRSELSNGVQLADLCSYNIYRAFKSGDLAYPFFQKIAPHIWSKSDPAPHPFSGLRVFPTNSRLRDFVRAFENERASGSSPEAL